MTSESSSSRIPDVQGRSNALAESIIGLYKTELIRTRGPWRQSPLARGLDGGEIATMFVPPTAALVGNAGGVAAGAAAGARHPTAAASTDNATTNARARFSIEGAVTTGKNDKLSSAYRPSRRTALK